MNDNTNIFVHFETAYGWNIDGEPASKNDEAFRHRRIATAKSEDEAFAAYAAIQEEIEIERGRNHAEAQREFAKRMQMFRAEQSATSHD
jgi:hypothetical protein